MQNQLFIGNLSFRADETDLGELLAAEGFEVVQVHIVADRMSGASRGFAFATLKTEEDVIKAVEKLSGKILYGRAIRCGAARGPKKAR